MKDKYKILFIIVLVFVLMRLAALFAFIDVFYDYEERVIGAIAKEIMEGPDLPLLEYTYNPYEGGSFIMSFITIPFFFLFGANFFSFKLVALLISTVTLIVFFLFVWRLFNKRIALIMAILYLFSSIEWMIQGLAVQHHLLCLLFSVLGIYIFYEIIFNLKTKFIYYLLLGIILGLGIYISNAFLATISAILVVWLIHDRQLFIKKEFYIFFSGFFIGLIPWLYYNLIFQFLGASSFQTFFVERNYLDIQTWLDIILRFVGNIWFAKILGMRVFGKYFSRFVYGTIYLLIYLFSFLYILLYKKNSFKKFILSKDFFVLFFPIFLIAINTLYGVNVQEEYFGLQRYLLGLFPFVFLTIAITLDRLFLEWPKIKPIIIKLFSLNLILILSGYIGRIDPKDFGKGFKEPGYQYMLLSYAIWSKHTKDFYKILDYMTRLSAPEKYEVIYLPLNIIPEKNFRSVDFKEYLKLSYRLSEKYRPYFYKMLIKGLYVNSDLSIKDVVREVGILSKQVDAQYKPYLYEGIGVIVVCRYPGEFIQYKEFGRFIDEPFRAYYYRGLTEFLDDIPSIDLLSYINRFKNCMKWLEEKDKTFYLDGIGETFAKLGFGLTQLIIPDDSKPAKIFRSFFLDLEPRYKRYILAGLGKGLGYFCCPNNEMAAYKIINTFFKKEDREIILRSMLDSLEEYD